MDGERQPLLLSNGGINSAETPPRKGRSTPPNPPRIYAQDPSPRGSGSSRGGAGKLAKSPRNRSGKAVRSVLFTESRSPSLDTLRGLAICLSAYHVLPGTLQMIVAQRSTTQHRWP